MNVYGWLSQKLYDNIPINRDFNGSAAGELVPMWPHCSLLRNRDEMPTVSETNSPEAMPQADVIEGIVVR
jgi:hypothetical protein